MKALIPYLTLLIIALDALSQETLYKTNMVQWGNRRNITGPVWDGDISGPWAIIAQTNGKVVVWGQQEGTAIFMLPISLKAEPSIAVRTSNNHFLSLTSNYKVFAWGMGHLGGTPIGKDFPVPALATQAVDIAVTVDANLILKKDGSLFSWRHALNSEDTQCPFPDTLTNVVDIEGGTHYFLARRKNGSVYGWSKCQSLENRPETIPEKFNFPENLRGVTAMSGGRFHTLLLMEDSTVQAFSSIDSLKIVPDGLNNVVAVSAGTSHNLALKADGSIIAWGGYETGHLEVPLGLSDVVKIAAGTKHNMAILRNGRVVVWTARKLDSPNSVLKVPSSRPDVNLVTSSTTATYMAHEDGSVSWWGFLRGGDNEVPAGLENLKFLASSGPRRLALTATGIVVGWGPSTLDSLILPIPDSISQMIGTIVSMGNTHAAILKNDSTVSVWGKYENRLKSPPDTMAGVVSLESGKEHTVSLTKKGEIFAWGANTDRQLNIPSHPDGATLIAAGNYHSLALIYLPGKTKMAIVAWGKNTDGCTTIPSPLDTIFEGDPKPISLAAGDAHSIAHMDNGDLIIWGRRDFRLGSYPKGIENIKSVQAFEDQTIVLLNQPLQVDTLQMPDLTITPEDPVQNTSQQGDRKSQASIRREKDRLLFSPKIYPNSYLILYSLNGNVIWKGRVRQNYLDLPAGISSGPIYWKIEFENYIQFGSVL